MRSICFGKLPVQDAGVPVKMGQTFLATTMTAADETLSVNSATPFCSDMVPFKMAIDPTGTLEIVVVKGISGKTFTIQRGAEGTDPAAHTSGAVLMAMFPFAGWELSSVSGGTGKVYWGQAVLAVSTGVGVIHEFVPQSTAVDDRKSFLATSQQGNPLNLTDFGIDVVTSAQALFVTLWER